MFSPLLSCILGGVGGVALLLGSVFWFPVLGLVWSSFGFSIGGLGFTTGGFSFIVIVCV